MPDSNEELFDLKHRKEFQDKGPADGPAPAPAVDVRGRCGDCWGQVAGHKDEAGRWTRLECRVCGRACEGRAAHREMQHMWGEATANLSGARFGEPPRYRADGRFFLKLLPDMVRDVAKVDAVITDQLKDEQKLKEARKQRQRTRREFSKGGAGNFYLQACALMAGLRYLPFDFGLIPPLHLVLERFQARDVTEDNRFGRRKLRVQGVLEDEKPDLVKKMGATLIAKMMGALACELAMKAILMTRVHTFTMTHDLKDLFDALPPDCRKRLVADFPQITEVLSLQRESFDKSRYFNPTENERAIENLIDSDGALDLAKAARVLIDEGLIGGLNYEVKVGPDIQYEVDEGGLERRFGQVEITGSESSIDWDQFAR